MPYVPDDFIPFKIEYQMQGHGELHHAQIGRQVAAAYGDLLHQEIADLLRELRILLRRNAADIPVFSDLIQ